MKKILLSFLLIGMFVFVTKAQDAKPSKEATQRFINSVLKSVTGESGVYGDMTIKIQSFNENFETYSLILVTDKNRQITEDDSTIKWEDFSAFNKLSVDDNPNIILFYCIFTSKVQHSDTDLFSNTKSTSSNKCAFYFN